MSLVFRKMPLAWSVQLCPLDCCQSHECLFLDHRPAIYLTGFTIADLVVQCSPDTSSIEDLWDALDQYTLQHVPAPSKVTQLHTEVEHEDRIPQPTMNNLISSEEMCCAATDKWWSYHQESFARGHTMRIFFPCLVSYDIYDQDNLVN